MSSAIVLAGGASRRFGSDKLAERIDGMTLLERSIGALDGLVDEIVVVDCAGPGLLRALHAAGAAAVRFVADAEAFGGPLVGLRTGLAAARGETVLVVGGDMPSLVPAVLELLLGGPPAALGDATGSSARCPAALERPARARGAEVLLAGGERRLRALLARAGNRRLCPGPNGRSVDPDGLTLADIDEPERSRPRAEHSETPTLRPGSRGRRSPIP